MIDEFLFETTVRSVKGIDQELRSLCDKSIFFAPELYVGFCIGMEVTREAKRRNILIEWHREVKGQGSGPVDLLFKVENEIIYLELKLADTYDQYRDDIQKLRSIREANAKKYFCVLLDSFSEENDDRLIKLENEFSNVILSKKHEKGFKAQSERYIRQTYCCINLYEVL